MRSMILETARRLTLAHGAVPSLNSVVVAAKVSKGGLMHHFPSRSALIAGLAREAIDEVDDAMSRAAAAGTAARTWLELSLLGESDRVLMQALASGFHPSDAELHHLLEDAITAINRWEALIAAEVGDPIRAHAIRLVGDAMAANSVFGLHTDRENIDALLTVLSDTASGAKGKA